MRRVPDTVPTAPAATLAAAAERVAQEENAMTKIRFLPLATAAALASTSPAAALPLDQGALQARLPGAEIRVNYAGPRGMEDHVWRLQADGSVTAVYMRAPIASDRGGAPEVVSGTGRWSVQGNQLCVDVQGIMSGRQACFVVDTGAGNRVTLVAGNSLHILRGTIERR